MEIIKIDGRNAAPNLRSNCYLIVDGDECCVVDPSFGLGVVKQKLREIYNKDIRVVSAILTHCHADHCAALPEFASAKIYLTERTREDLSRPNVTLSHEILGKDMDTEAVKDNFVLIASGDEVELVSGCKFRIQSTAGHTSDSISIYNDKDIFVGDLIFARKGVGRTDLLTGSVAEVRDSLRWLFSLPATLIVHSGHGEDFALGDW